MQTLHELDVNILLSDYVTADSRIQLWRSVPDRVARAILGVTTVAV